MRPNAAGSSRTDTPDVAPLSASAHGLHDLIAAQVKAQPQQCAVRDSKGRSITYGELWARSGWLASLLVERGIGRGDRIAVAIERSLEFVVGALGVIRTGAAYVPLDPGLPVERLRTVLDDSSASTAVTAQGEGLTLAGIISRIELPDSWPEQMPGGTPSRAVEMEDQFCIFYTSGSSGSPKGVLISHRAVVSYVTDSTYYHIGPGGHVANVGSTSFDVTTLEVWTTLVAGATVVVMPSAQEIPVREWREILRAHRISAMVLTPAVLEIVVREDPSAFRELETLMIGGDVVHPAMILRIYAAGAPRRLIHVYGPTEATTIATTFECFPDNIPTSGGLPIGFPLKGIRAYILDSNLAPVDPGSAGELCLGGDQVASGYLNRPELTSQKFVRVSGDLVYRTGDYARQRHDGALEFLGRMDRQVKVRGFRIELSEIENSILATGLAAGAVVEKVGDGANSHLAGFVVPAREDLGDLAADLTRSLLQRLPGHMVPRRWRFLKEFPINAHGKLDRAALIAYFNQHATADLVPATAGSDSLRDNASEVGLVIGQVIAELLQIAEVRSDHNFLELGGNSIIAMQVMSRLCARLGVKADFEKVLLSETIGELCEYVASLAE